MRGYHLFSLFSYLTRLLSGWPAPRLHDALFFHGQNVYLGQRSPIMRIFLFLLFVIFFQCEVKYLSNPLPPCYHDALE